MTRTSPTSRAPEPDVNKSLALDALYQRLQDSAACSILDLGSALGINLQFWSVFGPSMHIADLHSSMQPAGITEDQISSESYWTRVLALPEYKRFDVVLAWDLINYFDQAAAAGLIQCLARFCSRGSILFALIYDRHEMPALPVVFKIKDKDNLIYETQGSGMRPCPRHQPRDVQRMFAGFRVSNSFRLRNGVQEYLFEYGE